MTTVLRLVLGATLALYFAMIALHIIYLGFPIGDARVPDVRWLGYDAPEIRIFLDGLSDQGRMVYETWLAWLDTAFPPFLALSLVLVFRGLSPAQGNGRLVLFAVLPAVYLACDLAENSFVAGLNAIQDDVVFAEQVEIASWLTRGKFAALAMTLIPLVRLMWQRARAST